MSRYEIFCSDPALSSYFAKHLREPSCMVILEDTSYYLYSCDIEALENSANLEQGTDGLLSVFNLLSANFQTLRTAEKVEIGVQGLLFILDGVIKLKYKMPGFTRVLTISPSQVRAGIVSKMDNSGRVVKTKTRSIPIRICVTVGEDFLLDADTRPPTGMEIWRIARNTPFVASALYYYGKAQLDDTTNLRKVIELIMADTYVGLRREPKFKKWKEQWPKKVVGQNKIEELWEWLNNAYVSGDKAAHSHALSYQQGANIAISDSEALNIIHMLLMNWLEEKYSKL